MLERKSSVKGPKSGTREKLIEDERLCSAGKRRMSRIDSMEKSCSASVRREKDHNCVSVFIQRRVAGSELRSVGAPQLPAGRWIRGLAEPWESRDVHRLWGWELVPTPQCVTTPPPLNNTSTRIPAPPDARRTRLWGGWGAVWVIPTAQTGGVWQLNLWTVWAFIYLRIIPVAPNQRSLSVYPPARNCFHLDENQFAETWNFLLMDKLVECNEVHEHFLLPLSLVGVISRRLHEAFLMNLYAWMCRAVHEITWDHLRSLEIRLLHYFYLVISVTSYFADC